MPSRSFLPLSASALAILLFLTGAGTLLALDDDRPIEAQRLNRPLPVPVRVEVVHLTRAPGRKVQSVRLPVFRLETGKTAQFKLGTARYEISAAGWPGEQVMVRIVYAALSERREEYRVIAKTSVALPLRRSGTVTANGQEFRVRVEPLPSGEAQDLRYTGRGR